MIATRPDWCISRQRLWGVPIPAFYCKGCGEILLRADLARHVAGLFEAETADAWYAREAKDLLPSGFACPKCGGAEFDKETDILDVWFDSGSSHAAVLGQRDDLPWPADVYLEGSDQHRGWFHSSLLIGVATRGQAPYRQVITHGFTVDGEGKKISKSLGNDVDTQKLINTYGAEVLRLWTIMVDYREDMRISDDMIKRVAEAYRKVRNTIRYLVSNLNDFDPARDTVAEEALDELDRYALARHRQVVARVLDAYDAYEFHLVYHQLVQYARVRSLLLLPRRPEGPALLRRRGGQPAPLRPDRAPPDRPGPVPPPGPRPPLHHRRGLALHPRRARRPPCTSLCSRRGRRRTRRSSSRWAGLLDVRAEVTKVLEDARAAKQLAASLEGAVVLRGPASVLLPLRAHEAKSGVFPGNLANLFIVSAVRLEEAEAPPARLGRARRGREVRALLDVVEGSGNDGRPPRRLRALRGGPGPPVKRHLPHLLLMAAIVLLDQGTKALVVRSLPLHGYVPLVDGLLSLSHVRNRGAAFGILSDWDLPHQTLLLSLLSLGALLAIAVYFVRLPATARLPRVALALVLGGAVGNLLDRLRLGYVVDFVHVYWRRYQWPDFNVADSAITVGVTLLVLDILRSPGASSADAKPGIEAAAPTAGRID